jgi:hypothetical protein
MDAIAPMSDKVTIPASTIMTTRPSQSQKAFMPGI